MSKVIVTGGCGYIGSHTIVDLINNGFEVVSIDNNSKSNETILDRVKTITGKQVTNYKVDICDLKKLQIVFEKEKNISGVIHFAAYKAVGESVAEPLLYFHNNLTSLVNILQCVQDYDIKSFIFSSSCTVYGSATALPVTEQTPMGVAESPYGRTKQMGEHIVTDYSKAHDTNTILLRYFNPVGAHESALIGELPLGKPNNLVPVITQTAIGKIEKMKVFGKDYDTKDGTCVRDYIHVMDIASAHTKALQYSLSTSAPIRAEVFNLGTGNGVTVLEVIKAFEKVSGEQLNYEMAERRPGDIMAIYANNEKANKVLSWQPQIEVEEMMNSAWRWEKNLKNNPLK